MKDFLEFFFPTDTDISFFLESYTIQGLFSHINAQEGFMEQSIFA